MSDAGDLSYDSGYREPPDCPITLAAIFKMLHKFRRMTASDFDDYARTPDTAHILEIPDENKETQIDVIIDVEPRLRSGIRKSPEEVIIISVYSYDQDGVGHWWFLSLCSLPKGSTAFTYGGEI